MSWNWERCYNSSVNRMGSIFTSISRPTLTAPASLRVAGWVLITSADAAYPSRALIIFLYPLSHPTSGLSEQAQDPYILLANFERHI